MNASATFTSVEQCLTWLEKQHPEHDIELGLGRISQVAKQLLGDRPIAKQVITVAGTNGKGSTVAFLGAILEASGLTYGALTSPHFVRFNERICFNGEMVSDADLCASFERVNQARIEAAATPVELTYFEFNTLVAFDLMQHKQPDVALLEVGLGGRLDAVNVIDADIAIVTSIALDHMDWLGSDLEVIGREKAGIFRAGKVAIFGQIDGPMSVGDHAQKVGSRWYQNGQHFLQDEQLWKGESGNLTVPKVSLPAMNVAAVVQAIKLLPFAISDAAIQTGLAEARLAGRYQELNWQGKKVILDVAHNPHAAANLCRSLAQEKGAIHGVFAMLSDKDYDAVIKTMSEQLEHWFLAPSVGPRGLDLSDLTSSLQQSGVAEDHYHACGSIVEALQQALAYAQPTDKILVFGSFQTVGEVLAYFEQQQQG